jgi:trigger factor
MHARLKRVHDWKINTMATVIEQTGTLERRLQMAVSADEVTRQVGQKLRELSRTVKMAGFRPGKVPLSMIERTYGGQVRADVLGEVVSKAFSDAVDEHKLRVAGQPRIEPGQGADEGQLSFTATFEVYPEVMPGDASSLKVDRIRCEIGDAEIDKTIEVLRKQRTTWAEAQGRPVADGDRATIDFKGTLDGTPFEGGTASDFAFVLGEGRMLPDFEIGVRGMTAGETRSFAVAFPAEYGSKDLAGKTAQFEVTLKKLESGTLPEINAAFVSQFGIADGDTERLRADIRRNLEREVSQRLRARIKTNVMEALPALASFELPKALVESESATLAERVKADLQSRGMDLRSIPVPPDAFRDQAEKRVRLGLLVAEIVRRESLQAKPEQIRSMIEEFAQAYENPAEIVRHYFSNRERLAEVEALVVEQNVVDWLLGRAQVTEVGVSFDDLMAQQQN